MLAVNLRATVWRNPRPEIAGCQQKPRQEQGGWDAYLSPFAPCQGNRGASLFGSRAYVEKPWPRPSERASRPPPHGGGYICFNQSEETMKRTRLRFLFFTFTTALLLAGCAKKEKAAALAPPV